MGPEVWGPVAAAVSALVLLAVKLFSAQQDKQRKADNAISKRDRDELRVGMAAIDGMHRDKPVPPNAPTGVRRTGED